MKIDIFFNEWKNDMKMKHIQKIFITNILTPDTKIVDKTKYYIFNGCFMEENIFRVKPKNEVKLWFSKKSFDKELIRWIDFGKLDQPAENYSAEISVTRISKRDLIFINFDLQFQTFTKLTN